jgi:hypothetical protein
VQQSPSEIIFFTKAEPASFWAFFDSSSRIVKRKARATAEFIANLVPIFKLFLKILEKEIFHKKIAQKLCNS